MPRRHNRTRRNPEEDDQDVGVDDTGDAPASKKKKKKRSWGWLKWVGATAAGAVIGGVAMRKYDQYFPADGAKRNPEDGGAQPAMPGIQPPQFMPLPLPMPMPMPMPGYGAPQPNPTPKRRKSTAELALELKERKAAEREARLAAVEEEWYAED